jgi:two-component system OmpR family response regulator
VITRLRILVVEDSAKMAGLLKLGLEREGYAVDVTASAVDAVWLACEHGYDVVVLDVILDAAGQQADGFEVCGRLRQAGCWVPVLMVTARDAVRDRVRGLDAGADDYLPKPFHLPEFLARVRALIRRGAVARPAVLTVGDLSLDPARHGETCGKPHRPDQDRVRAARVPHAARR